MDPGECHGPDLLSLYVKRAAIGWDDESGHNGLSQQRPKALAAAGCGVSGEPGCMSAAWIMGSGGSPLERRYYLFPTVHDEAKPLPAAKNAARPTDRRRTVSAVSESPWGRFARLR